MLAKPRTWLPSALVLLATLMPLRYVADASAHLLAFGALALDVLGVMAARAAYGRIASAVGLGMGAAGQARPGRPAPSSGGFDRALLLLTGAGDRREALRWCQSVVHSAGMGFGLSAVLLVCYLAYLYGF
jgi:hypothetical protein